MNYPYMSEEAKRWLAGKGEYRLTTVPYQVAGGWLWAFILAPVLVAVITSIPGVTGTGFGLGLGASMVFALSFPPILKRVRRESAESAGSGEQANPAQNSTGGQSSQGAQSPQGGTTGQASRSSSRSKSSNESE